MVPVDAAPVENQIVLLLEPEEVVCCDKKSVLTTSRAEVTKIHEKKMRIAPKNTAREWKKFHFIKGFLVSNAIIVSYCRVESNFSFWKKEIWVYNGLDFLISFIAHMKKLSKKGFTLVELVVVVTILTILASIWYISYSSNIIDARDTQRQSDMDGLKIDLKSHKQKEGAYPLPINPFTLTNTGIVAYQWVISDTIVSNVLKNIPRDPKTKNWYTYWVNANRQQFQIALTKENQDSPRAIVSGDYKSVAKNLFPTLLVAFSGTTIDMNESVDNPNRKLFILNGGSYNLPYDMAGQLVANSTVDFTGITTEAGVTIETGGNYFSCSEIYEAGMSMGSGTYQIVNASGALTDTGCTMIY